MDGHGGVRTREVVEGAQYKRDEVKSGGNMENGINCGGGNDQRVTERKLVRRQNVRTKDYPGHKSYY